MWHKPVIYCSCFNESSFKVPKDGAAGEKNSMKMGSAPLRSSTSAKERPAIDKDMSKCKSESSRSSSNTDEVSEDMNENLNRLEEDYKFLTEINDTETILNSRVCLKKFMFMSKLSLHDQFRQVNQHFKILPKYNIHEVMVNLMSACFDETRAFVNKYQCYDGDPAAKQADKSVYKRLKRSYLYLYELCNVALQYTDTSIWFCFNFHEKGGTKILLDYLSDETFLENCKRFKSHKYEDDARTKKDDTNKSGLALTRLLVGTVHNLTKIADEYKKDWQDLGATGKLLKFSEIFQKHASHRLTSYMAIANIVNDKQIETLPSTKYAIDDLIQLVYLGGQALRIKTDIHYTKIDLNQSGKMDTLVSVVFFEDTEFNMIELLEALNKLAVNDTIKYSIYQSSKMPDTIKNILFNGNAIEKEYATKLLWQLCFDRRVCQAVAKESVLVEYLKKRLGDSNASYVLKQNITGIMWLFTQLKGQQEEHGESSLNNDNLMDLDDFRFNSARRFSSSSDEAKELEEVNDEQAVKEKKDSRSKKPSSRDLLKKLKQKSQSKEVSNSSSIIQIVSAPESSVPNKQKQNEEKEASFGDEKKGHIMISYNRETRDLCLKIKQELHKMGYQVWIDVEDIHGSSLESMARAIENSACVLICMTEKYKQSPYCRAEAEYTFNLGKAYVPLVVSILLLGFATASNCYIYGSVPCPTATVLEGIASKVTQLNDSRFEHGCHGYGYGPVACVVQFKPTILR